jgi:hypothetical protein
MPGCTEGEKHGMSNTVRSFYRIPKGISSNGTAPAREKNTDDAAEFRLPPAGWRLQWTVQLRLDSRAGKGDAGMSQRKIEENPPEALRKEIFQALVDAQDQEMTVPQSRKLIAERFQVSENLVRDIEREGLDRQWPPL